MELDTGQLGNAIDQTCHGFSELRLNVVKGDCGILNGVVQECGNDGIGIKVEISKDAGHFQGVREVGIAGRASLCSVRLHSEDVGAID